VKHVDYPAVVPESIGKRVLGRELTEDEGSVRGTVVKGLKSSDISLLDIFEGDVRRPSSFIMSDSIAYRDGQKLT
jgi:hypothetical protein